MDFWLRSSKCRRIIEPISETKQHLIEERTSLVCSGSQCHHAYTTLVLISGFWSCKSWACLSQPYIIWSAMIAICNITKMKKGGKFGNSYSMTFWYWYEFHYWVLASWHRLSISSSKLRSGFKWRWGFGNEITASWRLEVVQQSLVWLDRYNTLGLEGVLNCFICVYISGEQRSSMRRPDN